MKHLALVLSIISLPVIAGGYEQPVKYSQSSTNIAKGGQGGKANSASSSKAFSDSVSKSAAVAVSGDTSVDNDLNNFGNSSVSNANTVNVDMGEAIAVPIEIEGSTWNAGNTMINNSLYQPRDFIGYQAPLGTVQIGDVSVSTSACGFTVGYNNEKRQFGGSGGAIAGGCSFPLGGAKSALGTATRKLEYELHVMETNEIRVQALHDIEVTQIVERHEVEMAEMCVLLHRAGTTLAADYAKVCSNIGFVDAEHTPMPDVESHQRIGDH